MNLPPDRSHLTVVETGQDDTFAPGTGAHQQVAVPEANQVPAVPDVPGQLVEADEVFDAELVDEVVTKTRPDRAGAPTRISRVRALQPSPRAVTLGAALLGAVLTVGLGWRSWLTRPWDAATHGVYRRQIRAAEAMGNTEQLAEWTLAKEQAVTQRHHRLQDLPSLVLGLASLAIRLLIGITIAIPVLAIALQLARIANAEDVIASIIGAFRWAAHAVAIVWQVFVPALPVLLIWGGYRQGRRQGRLPGWLATSAEDDVDVEIDETTIARALDALRIPQITQYLKQGLPLQFIVPARLDGRGTYAELRLPTGVAAELISKPHRRAALATGLHRATKETWPSTGSEAGILKLWVADKGALAEGAGPYPLLADGTVDVFKGVPFGKTLRGDPIMCPVMERNTITGGMPGQGKSSSARSIMAGAALDPLAEMWIHVPDTNFDFELFKRRCARYVMGAEDEKVEQICDDLRDLYAEVQGRGQILIDHEEPAVTRKLAEAEIGLHPLFYLLEEAHLAIQHKLYGKEIAQLLIDIVKLGRKRGIHVIVSTQAPTKDSMPRDVTRNCSNGIAFAVGDHVANDGLLGQGAYRAGHRATELIPGTDIGTAVCKGLTGERSDIVQVYFICIEKGRDELTPIIDRAMQAIADRGQGLPGGHRAMAVEQPRDLLQDLDAVMGEESVPAADLPALLAHHAPRWPPYRAMSGKALRERLAALGVRVPTTGNRHPVSPADVRAALAARDDADVDGGE